MNKENKGRSPFYPGQPVPVELFVGRIEEIQRIARAARQVASGKSQAVFIQGEYGIGKTSLARFIRLYCEEEEKIFGIHILLGGTSNLDQLALKTVQSMIESKVSKPTTNEKIKNFLARYVSKAELFGITINLENLKADSPNIAKGYLPFLRETFNRIKDEGFEGILLIFDEINGISENPQFAYFIKELVDQNALSDDPLPLFLILCGVEEKWRTMIRNHKPVERIFDIAEISTLSRQEVEKFFTKAFGELNITVGEKAMYMLCHFSGGFPKLMHLIGDAAFWIDNDDYIDKKDTGSAIIYAAEDVGRKFLDPQVYKGLRSEHYQSILHKLGESDFSLSFQKSKIEKVLTPAEKKKFNNFLQKMKDLHVLKSGQVKGEYIFSDWLTRLYILMQASGKKE